MALTFVNIPISYQTPGEQMVQTNLRGVLMPDGTVALATVLTDSNGNPISATLLQMILEDASGLGVPYIDGAQIPVAGAYK